MDKLALLFLGFDEDASPTAEQVKDAFKKMSFICHPDHNGTDAMFRGLTMAKERILKETPSPKESKSDYGYNDPYSSFDAYNKTEITKLLNDWSETCCHMLRCTYARRVKQFRIQIDNSNNSALIVTTDGFTCGDVSLGYKHESPSMDDRIILYHALMWATQERKLKNFKEPANYKGTRVLFSYTPFPWYIRMWGWLP